MYLIAGRGRASSASASSASASSEPQNPAEHSFEAEIDPVEDYSDHAADGCDADLDDPDLLGELEALRAEMGLSAPPPDALKREPRASPKGGKQTTVFDEDDRVLEAVKVTEDDMADPHLLAELSKFSLSDVADRSLNDVADRSLNSPESLAARQQQLKAEALAAKRQGDMNRARELLVQMKDVQLLLSQLPNQPALAPTTPTAPRTNTSVGSTAQEPRKALAPQQSLPLDPSVRSVEEPRRTLAPQQNLPLDSPVRLVEEPTITFEAAKTNLDLQIAKATRLAAYYLKAADKPAALEFHRLKKRATADLALVASYKASGRPSPPPFSHKKVQWAAPVEQRRDISASELQIAIKRLASEGDLAATLGSKSDFFIQWELGWPRDKPRKAYTRTVKYSEFEASSGDVHVAYRHNVEFVDRQLMRPLQRWLDRGKLTVELYKYMGLFWGSQLVGRASLPLADLRTKSEVAALLEIKASSDALSRAGKPLPGGPVFVDVAALLRLPLSNKPEVVSHVERWIQFEECQLPQFDSPTTPAQPADSIGSKSEPVPSGPVLSPPATVDTGADDIAALLDAMDDVVSNAVLELELLQLPARMQEARGQEAASQLRDLDAAIKLRMSVVAAQVGAGTLSIQDYMAGVSNELAQAKQWAMAAKKAGRKDLALRALKRVKAMQGELDEMKAAMETGGE